MQNVNLRLTSLLASMVLCGIFVSCNNEENISPGDEAIITEEVKAQFTSLGFDVSDLTTTTGRENAGSGRRKWFIPLRKVTW